MDLIRSIVCASDVCDWLRCCFERYRRFGASHDLPDISFDVLVGPDTSQNLATPLHAFSSKCEAAVVFDSVASNSLPVLACQLKDITLGRCFQHYSENDILARISCSVMPEADLKYLCLLQHCRIAKPVDLSDF